MYLIKAFLTSFLLLICLNISTAQYQRAKVADFGQLFSTLSESELKDGLSGIFSGAKLAFVLENTVESGWPKGISTLNDRNTNRPKMYDYRMYKVTAFNNGSTALLLVPAAENQHMPADMRPVHDIYFAISNNTVTTESGTYTATTQQQTTTPQVAAEVAGEFDMRILDASAMISNYDLKSDEAAKTVLTEEAGLSEADFDILANACKESSWPEGINSYQKRASVRDQIKKYNAVQGASFYDDDGKDITIIHIPLEKNRHMPKNMQPNEDDMLYMIFNTEGLEFVIPRDPNDDEYDDFEYSLDIEDATDFSSQLNFVVESVHNNFEDILGDKVIPEEGDIRLGEEYESLIEMEKAERTYISKQLFGDARTFIASYGDYTDKELALNDFKYLSDFIQEISFECCTFVKNESINDNLMVTYWLPFDMNDIMHESLENILIEVQLAKGFDIDDNFKMIDTWSLVVRVSNSEK